MFYSILKSGSSPGGLVSSSLSATQHNEGDDEFEELYCIDDVVEKTIFKMSMLSSMFVEFYALPDRPGRTEVKMLQTAFSMRTNVYFKVFQTFI